MIALHAVAPSYPRPSPTAHVYHLAPVGGTAAPAPGTVAAAQRQPAAAGQRQPAAAPAQREPAVAAAAKLAAAGAAHAAGLLAGLAPKPKKP